MKNTDLIKHVRGESLFVDDLLTPEGLLHASVFTSPAAHGIIKQLDYKDALKVEGVTAVITADDIPGENQIGGIVEDEELLAKHKVDYIGQPVAIVIAKDQLTARQAAKKIKIEIEELPAVLNPREAFEKQQLIIPPRIFSLGNVNEAWKDCDIIVEGRVDSGGQEHLYLETQGCFAYKVENNIKIVSSTQSPSAVQKVAARVLGIPMHKVEVDVMRLGGGFGGKEDQASSWAAMAALAAVKVNKPVKLILPRQEDMRMTGKRHPYSSDYKIGLNKEGKILAYEVTYYQDAGASADLSPAILDRTLFHSTNAYFIPNVKATAYSCKTNFPPNTAFRGFGGPQGMFVIEAAIYSAAEKLGVDALFIQKKNLLKEEDEFSYGQKAEHCMSEKSWNEAEIKFQLEEIKKDIQKYNDDNQFVKKGMALMPICFGISFTTTFLNQATSLVHVYNDGSVGVSTAAIEMGQGVNMKIRQVIADVFSINIDKVKSESTNTTRNANTSATAASSGADLNGKATLNACLDILSRLKTSASEILNANEKKIYLKDEMVYVEDKPSGLSWKELISKSYMKRVNLSSLAHYATPTIFFNKETNKGKPFAYHVYGTAIIVVKVDCIKGTYEIESVQVVHDFGKSINKAIDKSQAEGAIMQGIGWMTVEEILHDSKGKLITDALSTYKVPDIYFAPKKIQVEFLENPFDNLAVFNSKAVGEPPFMYGIGAYFAILNAIKSFNAKSNFNITAPMTNEKVLTYIYNK